MTKRQGYFVLAWLCLICASVAALHPDAGVSIATQLVCVASSISWSMAGFKTKGE